MPLTAPAGARRALGAKEQRRAEQLERLLRVDVAERREPMWHAVEARA